MKGIAQRLFIILSICSLLQACGESSSNDTTASGVPEAGRMSNQMTTTAPAVSGQNGVDQVETMPPETTTVGGLTPQAVPQDSGSSQNQ